MTLKYMLVLTVLGVSQVLARDDGVALTPPMGWLSWARYACQTDCKAYPHACINEQLYKEQADRMAMDGFKELGYHYINIDDCWSEMQRDSQHRLVPNKQRFPNGIKGLADYMHSKGLKLGIYGDVGPKTCDGYPAQNGQNGSNYFKIDAKTFAEWGVDSFKFDGCNEDPKNFDKLYPEMGQALNESGRQILYSCEWPLYQMIKKMDPNYEAITKTCHLFRNYWDVGDSWGSVEGIINYYGGNNEHFIKYNGPGHFFDPDMLMVGDFGLSHEQSKTQMSMWAMWSSPLYMSNDLRELTPEAKAILQNKDVIAVNQDKHGLMARRVFSKDSRQVWVKPIEPIVRGVWSYAVLYMDSNGLGDRYYMSQKVSDLIHDLKAGTEFTVHDLFKEEGKEILGTVKSTDNLVLKVTTGGGSRMKKGKQVWVKPVEPTVKGIYFDGRDLGDKYFMRERVSDLIPNLKEGTEFTIHDLYKEDGKEIGTLNSTDHLLLLVATGGGSRMVKLITK